VACPRSWCTGLKGSAGAGRERLCPRRPLCKCGGAAHLQADGSVGACAWRENAWGSPRYARQPSDEGLVPIVSRDLMDGDPTTSHPPPPCRNGYCARFMKPSGSTGVPGGQPCLSPPMTLPGADLQPRPQLPSRWRDFQACAPSSASRAPPPVAGDPVFSRRTGEEEGQCVNLSANQMPPLRSPLATWGFLHGVALQAIHAKPVEGHDWAAGPGGPGWPPPGGPPRPKGPTAALPARFNVPGFRTHR